MYHDKCESRYRKTSARRRRRQKKNRLTVLILSMVMLVTVAVGGTLAYLTTKDAPVTNTFTPSAVACQVTENFDGTEKKNVNVKNTGDTEAYIRVRLVTYRVNDQNQHIGGAAAIPEFTPGTNWVKFSDYYYYTLPVKPGEKPVNDLIGQMTLTGSYADADGGKQVIEVMAEAIQSGPAEAVGNSWGVSITKGSVAAYSGN